MATLGDIAKIANVSTATVSRILNGKGEASAETIERVFQIAKELGYSYTKTAAVKTQEISDSLIVVLPDLWNPFFGELAAELEETAAEKGIRLLIRTTNDLRTKLDDTVQTLLEERPFGAIISSMNVSHRDLEMLEKAGILTITMDRSSFDHPYAAIIVDQVNGFYIGTKHLIENGCQRIIFMSSPKAIDLTDSREQGYRMALKLLDQGSPTVLSGELTMESGYEMISEYIKDGNEFDGIICCNDLMAIGAMKACQDHGLNIPGDVKIVGNDNLQMDRFLNPSLTSISQRKTEIAKTVINEIIAMKNKETLPKRIIIQPKLMIRNSSLAFSDKTRISTL